VGVRGPAPKSAAIKELEGNPGKRSIEKMPTPQGTYEVPKPPKHLLPEAKKAFKRLAQHLAGVGILNEATVDAFAEVCQYYAYYRIASEKMLKKGEEGVTEMQVSDSGYAQKSPLISLVNEYHSKWMTGAKEFGLTPISWARIMSVYGASGEKAEEDPMEKLLSGGM